MYRIGLFLGGEFLFPLCPPQPTNAQAILAVAMLDAGLQSHQFPTGAYIAAEKIEEKNHGNLE